jgi:hypothetical protein
MPFLELAAVLVAVAVPHLPAAFHTVGHHTALEQVTVRKREGAFRCANGMETSHAKPKHVIFDLCARPAVTYSATAYMAWTSSDGFFGGKKLTCAMHSTLIKCANPCVAVSEHFFPLTLHNGGGDWQPFCPQRIMMMHGPVIAQGAP